MLVLLAVLTTAHAQAPVDVGVVRQSDAVVVQKLLFPKAHSTELVSSIGIMPFSPYTIAPSVQIGLDHHLTESWSIGGVVGIGYGLQTATYNELEREYGIAPYAFGYLGSLLLGGAWAPVYAKASLDGAHIAHFDIYLAGRIGVTVEQSTIPNGGRPVAPTISPGLGSRIHIGRTLSLRLEVRDDILFQWRTLTDVLKVKQNVGLFAGLTSTLGRKKEKP